MLIGPTGCGKTVFVQNFLKFGGQSGYRDLGKDIEFHEGLPQSNDWVNDPKTKLIIIEDLMRESSSGGAIMNLVTKGSHQNNLSIIFITQHIFHQGKGQRGISLNAQYIVIFRNLRIEHRYAI